MKTSKKKDIIEHPNYGHGVVKKVTATAGDYAILDIYFEQEDANRQLNSRWVEKTCKYVEYTPQQKPKFKDGIYSESAELSTESWQVYLEKDTVVDEKFKESLNYIMQQVKPDICFAVVGWNCIVLIEPKEAETTETFENTAKKYMTKVLRGHPDFGSMELADGGLAINMADESVWQFIPASDVKRKENGEIKLEILLATRYLLMANCDEKKILALAKGTDCKQ